jgi:hypothetical protein
VNGCLGLNSRSDSRGEESVHGCMADLEGEQVEGSEEDLRSITTCTKEKVMTRRYCLFAMVFVLLQVGIASAQEFPIMDMIADKVIQKYQQSSCQELWQKKGKAKSAQEQKMKQLLRSDPQMRQAFINKVAPPIANKMFECGMIP